MAHSVFYIKKKKKIFAPCFGSWPVPDFKCWSVVANSHTSDANGLWVLVTSVFPWNDQWQCRSTLAKYINTISPLTLRYNTFWLFQSVRRVGTASMLGERLFSCSRRLEWRWEKDSFHKWAKWMMVKWKVRMKKEIYNQPLEARD